MLKNLKRATKVKEELDSKRGQRKPRNQETVEIWNETKVNIVEM